MNEEVLNWEECTEEEYTSVFRSNGKLTPMSSFSDPDGTSPYGHRVPAMDTDWGINDKTLVRLEMRKKSTLQGDWTNTYFVNRTYIK